MMFALDWQQKYFQDMQQNLVMVKLLFQKLPEGAVQGQAEVEQLISDLLHQAQSQGIQMQQSSEVQRLFNRCERTPICVFIS